MTTSDESHATGIFVYPDGRMNPASASRYVGVATKTLAIWRSKGLGPTFCKLSGRVFYFKVDVDRWVAERSDLVSSNQARAKELIRRHGRNEKLGRWHVD